MIRSGILPDRGVDRGVREPCADQRAPASPAAPTLNIPSSQGIIAETRYGFGREEQE